MTMTLPVQQAAITASYPSHPSGAPVNDQNSMARILTAAQNAAAYADSRGWDVPKQWAIAQGQYRAAALIALTPTPSFPVLPATVEAMPKLISAYAKAVTVHEMSVRVAREAVDACTAAMAQIHRTHLPAWVDRLCEQFAAAVEVFLVNVATSPGTMMLTGYEDENVVAAMQGQLRVLASLDQMLAMRVTMGIDVGEPDAHAGALFMVVDVPADNDEAITAGTAGLLVQAQKAFHTKAFGEQPAIDRWRYLASLGDLSLPRFGEVHARLDRFDRLRGVYGGAPLMTELGQQNQLDEQDRLRRDQLAGRAKNAAAIEANSAAVDQQRAMAANGRR